MIRRVTEISAGMGGAVREPSERWSGVTERALRHKGGCLDRLDAMRTHFEMKAVPQSPASATPPPPVLWAACLARVRCENDRLAEIEK